MAIYPKIVGLIVNEFAEIFPVSVKRDEIFTVDKDVVPDMVVVGEEKDKFVSLF